MATPSGFKQLKDFPEKISPAASDIFYSADSTDNFNERKVSLTNIANNLPSLHVAKYIVSAPFTYTNGAASQAGMVVNGFQTAFTEINARSGMLIVFADGNYAFVTNVIDDTTLYVDHSNTVTQQSFTIFYGGFQVDSFGYAAASNFLAAPLYPNRAMIADFTVEPEDYAYFIDSTSGDLTVNLIAANQINGKAYLFKKTDYTASEITILPDGSDTIDGLPDFVMSFQSLQDIQSVLIVSDGISDWKIIFAYTPSSIPTSEFITTENDKFLITEDNRFIVTDP